MSSPVPSQPGTPHRSRNTTPEIITPRTKYRLLLADSSDSDDDAPITSKPKPAATTANKHTPANDAAPPATTPDSDDDIPMDDAPREGTLAARMRGIAPAKKTPAKPTAAQSTPAPPKTLFAADDSDDADEEDVPRSGRRTKLRSPAAAARERDLLSPQPARDMQSSDEDVPAAGELLRREKVRQLAERRRAAGERGRAEKEMEAGTTGGEEEERKGKGRGKRAAGKKALEEMHRETARLARNMQLAHEARSRVKVTKGSLFEKFGFKPENLEETYEKKKREKRGEEEARGDVEMAEAEEAEAAGKDGEKDGSDIEDIFDKLIAAAQAPAETPKAEKENAPLPSAESPSTPKPDKGKGKAPASPRPAVRADRPLRVHLPAAALQPHSDDELDFVDPAREAETERLRIAAEKQKLIQSLIRERKYTAHLPAAKKKDGMSIKELHRTLAAKSRRQAVDEREERIQELRAQGIHVPTAEEREKEMAEVENLVEKARLEALRIKRMERRRERREKGEAVSESEGEGEGVGASVWAGEIPEEEGVELYSDYDEEADGDFVDGEAEDEDEEGEEEGDDEEEGERAEKGEKDTEMAEADAEKPLDPTPSAKLSDMPDFPSQPDSDDDEEEAFSLNTKHRRKARVIVDDDDDDDDEAETPQKSGIPAVFKNFAAPSIGMTQLFAGSAASPEVPSSVTAKVDKLREAPAVEMPNSQARPHKEEREVLVDDSQLPKVDLSYDQSQVEREEPEEEGQGLGEMQGVLGTQDLPEPTQDWARTQQTEISQDSVDSQETVPTQIIGEELEPSQPRRGKLRRRQDFSDEERDGSDEEVVEESESEVEPAKDVFKVMKKAARRKQEQPFDKKNSEAKGMVEEQASESEDEYKGIGGASDDEADDLIDDPEIRAMLNDANDEEIDEDQLAAYYAKRAVADDEKNVNKLFRDLQSGLLRRKRGAGAADLDDSDDEYAEVERRRRAKKRQMEAIRRLLTQDQTLEKIAKDPKKAAFFKSLEGDGWDVDDSFLDREDDDDVPDTQDTATDPNSPTPAVPDTPHAELPVNASTNPRRTGIRTKKPALSEIRSKLSFLTEDSVLLSGSDSEPEPAPPAALPRRATTIIDRSVTRAAGNAVQTKLAFKTDGGAPGGFRVPTLLKRNSTALANASAGGAATGVSVTERSLGEEKAKKAVRGKAVNAFKKRERADGGGEERKRKREREVERVKKERAGALGIGGGSFE